jgi:hypothetical protein
MSGENQIPNAALGSEDQRTAAFRERRWFRGRRQWAQSTLKVSSRLTTTEAATVTAVAWMSIPAYAREHGLPVWRVYDRVAAGTIGSVVVKGHVRIPV